MGKEKYRSPPQTNFEHLLPGIAFTTQTTEEMYEVLYKLLYKAEEHRHFWRSLVFFAISFTLNDVLSVKCNVRNTGNERQNRQR